MTQPCKCRLKLSGTGNNHLELAITIIQHLNQSRTPEIDPHIRARTYHYHTEQTKKHHNTLQNHQEPYKYCHNHAKIATPILI